MCLRLLCMNKVTRFSHLFFLAQKGFTLIELMVVVSIIGVLMAAGILTFANAQKGAKDTKRKGDVDSISKAMEQYYLTNKAYPTASYATAIGGFFPSGSLPVDSAGTAYTLTSTATTYCVCALLDRAGTGNATSLGSGGACAFAAGGNYVCAAQRQ